MRKLKKKIEQIGLVLGKKSSRSIGKDEELTRDFYSTWSENYYICKLQLPLTVRVRRKKKKK